MVLPIRLSYEGFKTINSLTAVVATKKVLEKHMARDWGTLVQSPIQSFRGENLDFPLCTIPTVSLY
jgi:hypothetical protein